MTEAYIYDGIRTPFGRYGGVLSCIRTDDLAALVIASLVARNPDVDWKNIDDVYFGCANQAGEDNRNVARMASLLAGLPLEVPGVTLNRLCGSSLDAVGSGSRAIKSGDVAGLIVGGVESMSRAPFVLPKPESAYSRVAKIEDTTIGWRFVNDKMRALYGIDSMPETAENVAAQFHVARQDQDQFALRSQLRYRNAYHNGYFEDEILTVEIPQKGKGPTYVSQDEHPRETSLELLGRLKGVVHPNGTVTAGNSSGINDGAVALLLGSESFGKDNGLRPRARILAMTTVGVEPRIMGIGPISAIRRLLDRVSLDLDDIDVIELNEAFAAQAIAVLRELGIPEDSDKVNPNGGAIAIGHPLGASGARLVLTALRQLEKIEGRFALCSMCVGVGQGVALLMEKM